MDSSVYQQNDANTRLNTELNQKNARLAEAQAQVSELSRLLEDRFGRKIKEKNIKYKEETKKKWW
mgnify:CR=1 FL=1